MNSFFNFIAICAILFSVASLWAGHYQFENMYKNFGLERAGLFTKEKFRRQQFKFWRRHAAILVISCGWLLFG